MADNFAKKGKAKPKGGKSKESGGKWMSVLLFPPVLLIPIFFFTVVAGRDRDPYSAFVPVLLAMMLSFLSLSFAYIMLLKLERRKQAYTASALGVGVLVLFAAFGLGTGALMGWLGALVLLGGLGSAMVQITPQAKPRFNRAQTPDLLPDNLSKEDIKRLLEAMVLPAAFLQKDEEGEERILTTNDTLALALGQRAEDMQGVPFSTLFPDEERTFRLSDSEWSLHRQARGKQALFMLAPLVKRQEELVPQDAIDAESGAYTESFLHYKGNSDVQACRRYQHNLSVILFRLAFDQGNSEVLPSQDSIGKACAAFGQMLVRSTRACDSVFRMGEEDYLLLIPEGSQSGTKSLASRLREDVRRLATVECPELGAAVVKDVQSNFFGDELVSIDQVVRDIYMALSSNR